MLYTNMHEPDNRIAPYQAYTEAIAKIVEIMQSHEAVVAEPAEEKQVVSTIKETPIEQEPEVITYDVTAKKIRTPNWDSQAASGISWCY